MAKPEGYTLPWCDELDVPWWKINSFACGRSYEWRAYQKDKVMAQLIPVLRWRLFL